MKVYVLYLQRVWEEPETIGVYLNEEKIKLELQKDPDYYYLEFDLIE